MTFCYQNGYGLEPEALQNGMILAGGIFVLSCPDFLRNGVLALIWEIPILLILGNEVFILICPVLEPAVYYL